MRFRSVVLLGLLLATTHATAADDPLRPGLDRLRQSIDELGNPAAGEVASERAELAGVLAGLQRRAAALASDRDSVASEQKSLDFANRHRDDQLRQIDLDQRTHDNELAELMVRAKAHYEDAMAQHAAAAAATTEAQIASSNAWGAEVNRRVALLEAEKRELDEQRGAIEGRRADIATDVIGHAQRANWLQRRRSLVDRETSVILAECSKALSRALALKQIANSPARASQYEAPDALANKVVADLFTGIAQEAAMKGLEGKTMVKVLSKVGLRAQPVGMAYTVADTFADVALVGVDHRTKEVTKNLFLIGDYGEVMKQMVKARGGSATQTPEYVAMRAEMERLAAEMPSSSSEMLWQGLNNSAAIGAAFISIAGNYGSAGVEHFTGKITNRLNNEQRQTLGEGGVKFFRQAFEVLGSAIGDEGVQKSAEAIQSARERAREAQAKR